jgi:hypothetical protein
MKVVDDALGVVVKSANATAGTIGAVGGAAVDGVLGGMRGTAAGVKDGLRSGRHSTPAAALGLAAIGAAGLVDWPILVAVGGAALAVRELNNRFGVTPSSHPQANMPRATTATTSARRRGSQNSPRA